MTKHSLKTTTAAGLVLALLAAPAMAQDAFQAWDVNQDGAIGSEEFANRFGGAGVYGEWDANQDQRIDEQEFSQGFHDLYDADDSGSVEAEEYGELQNDLGQGASVDRGGLVETYSDWDADRDAGIDRAEFANRFGQSGAFASFDANRDERIDEEEFSEEFHGLYDVDDSGAIEEAEFGRLQNVLSSRSRRQGAEAAELGPDRDFDGTFGLDREEFESRFGGSGVYDAWDTDDDGTLSEQEFNAGLYGADELAGPDPAEKAEVLDDDPGAQGHWDRRSADPSPR